MGVRVRVRVRVGIGIRRSLSSSYQLFQEGPRGCAAVAIVAAIAVATIAVAGAVAVAVASATAPHALKKRIVYILSKGGSRHMANVAARHSQPGGAVCKITIVDERVMPSHAAR